MSCTPGVGHEHLSGGTRKPFAPPGGRQGHGGAVSLKAVRTHGRRPGAIWKSSAARCAPAIPGARRRSAPLRWSTTWHRRPGRRACGRTSSRRVNGTAWSNQNIARTRAPLLRPFRRAAELPVPACTCQAGLNLSTRASLARATGSRSGSQLKWVVTSTPPGASRRFTSAIVRTASKYIQHWLAVTTSKLASANGPASAGATWKSNVQARAGGGAPRRGDLPGRDVGAADRAAAPREFARQQPGAGAQIEHALAGQADAECGQHVVQACGRAGPVGSVVDRGAAPVDLAASVDGARLVHQDLGHSTHMRRLCFIRPACASASSPQPQK